MSNETLDEKLQQTRQSPGTNARASFAYLSTRYGYRLLKEDSHGPTHVRTWSMEGELKWRRAELGRPFAASMFEREPPD
jgi:hypothetical protein